MPRKGFNPELPPVPDFSQPNETPQQREARIQESLLNIPTRLGGTDLLPISSDHICAVNRQKRSGGHHGYYSRPPKKP